jgi:hypothetical protein
MAIKKSPSTKPDKPTLKEIMEIEKQTPKAAALTKSVSQIDVEELVQLNIRIPVGLHSKARIKALETRVQLKDVVAQLLSEWVKNN